jgi:hypothetical protein
MYSKRTNPQRISQGDLLEDVTYKFTKITTDQVEINPIVFPYAIVMTQDCDLEQDYNARAGTQGSQDKFLQSILVCPLYLAEQLRGGTHLEKLKLKMESYNTNRWDFIKSNQNQRYQFLPANTSYGFPDLVIDFKHYYTIPRDDIYGFFINNYVASVDILYREDVSQRYASYLSRIGTPDNTAIPPVIIPTTTPTPQA